MGLFKVSQLDRRRFLFGVAASAAIARPLSGLSTGVKGDSHRILLEVLDASPMTLPSRFLGLSYELDQASNSGFFSPQNYSLVQLFRGLGPGILRIGGATAEWTFIRSPQARRGLPERLDQLSVWQPAPAHSGNSSDRWAAQRVNYLSPEIFPALRGFLDACDWKCIYGVNFGSGTPEDAVVNVGLVSAALGERLEAVQIGNEPDFLFAYHLRPPPSRWWVNDFTREWDVFRKAISQAHPRIKIGGPDALGETKFAREFLIGRSASLDFASVHYYQSNDVDPVRSTVSELLKRDPELARRIESVRNLGSGHDLPVRLTETNSVSPGGKQGVSDTLAAGLWSVDFLLQLATLGVVGVNFHGGGSGPYTAIAEDLHTGFSERPLYKGMELVSRAVGGRLLNTRMSPPQSDSGTLVAYAVDCVDCRRIFLVNKHPQTAQSVWIKPGISFHTVRSFVLSGPSLEATQGIRLLQQDDPDMATLPKNVRRNRRDQGHFSVPAATSLLLEFLSATPY